MEKTDLKNLSAGMPATVTPTGEQLAKSRRFMERALLAILRIDESENIRWRGTLYDLVELARAAYDGGVVRGADGSPVAFAEIVRTVCRKLHVRPPYSPYNVAARAARRKGVRRHTLAERLFWLTHVAMVDDPIAAELERMR